MAIRRGRGELSFRYRHFRFPHATEIVIAGPFEMRQQNGKVSCALSLPSQQPVSLEIDVVPVFLGKKIAPEQGLRKFADGREALDCRGMRMMAGSALVQRAWDRATADLASLALLDGDGCERMTPAAGVPNTWGSLVATP